MKDKTIWQEVLNRGKWVLILLVAFVLSQFPIGLALFLANKQFPILQSGLLVGALSIVVDCIHYWCTKNTTCYF